jgi:hypothetical protein
MSTDEPAQSTAQSAADVTQDQTRGFLVTLVTLCLVSFDMAFTIAVYGDVFFETYLKIWAAGAAVIVGSMMVSRARRPVGPVGLIVLGLPTLYFPASVLSTWMLAHPLDESFFGLLTMVFALLTTVVMAIAYLIALPFVMYTLARILDPSLVQMPTTRMRVSLVAAAAILASAGGLMGFTHPYWMTCDEFEMAGNKAPATCTVDVLSQTP